MLPAARGRSHVLRVLREILARQGRNGSNGSAAALDALQQAVRRRALAFFISDMIGPDFSATLRPVARKHDITAVQVSDPADSNIPDMGLVAMVDPEDPNNSLLLDTSKAQNRTALAVASRRWREGVEDRFRIAGCPMIGVTTDADFTPALHTLLRRRSRHPR